MEIRTEELCKRALETWGDGPEFIMVFEEIGELIEAVSKWTRGRKTDVQVIEEIVDVEIMLKQLMLIMEKNTGTNYKEIHDRIYTEKLNRLESRLEK